jgi:hypothetical protein
MRYLLLEGNEERALGLIEHVQREERRPARHNVAPQ